MPKRKTPGKSKKVPNTKVSKKAPVKKQVPKPVLPKPKNVKKQVPKKVITPKPKEMSEIASKKQTPKKVITPKPKEISKIPSKKQTPKKVRQRKPVPTVETHLQKYNELMELLNKEIARKSSESEKGVRTLQTIRMKVKELQTEVPRVAGVKKKSGGSKYSGLRMDCNIRPEMREFLGLKDDEYVSRQEISNAICVYVRLKPDEKRPQMLRWKHLNPKGERNLQNPDDRMVILPDETLSKILDYSSYQKEVREGKIVREKTVAENGVKVKKEIPVENDELRYWVLTKLISRVTETRK